MKIPIAQSRWCDYRVISWPADYVLDIWPTPNFPRGDEARQIAHAWKHARGDGAPGLLLLGCDVAGDPDDLAALTASIVQAPADLHTGAVKLWPYSTKRDTWIWSHRGGTIGQPAVTFDLTAPIAYVSLGCLWVPSRLLDLAVPVMTRWQWGEADVKLSELALRHNVPAHLAPDCQPRHLHFQGEHDGQFIQRQAYRHLAS